MLLNHLKISFRNIQRQTGYSFINIASLTIGLTCLIFVAFWIQEELGFDQFHENKNRLYRILTKHSEYPSYTNVTTSLGLAPLLQSKNSEVEHFTRYELFGSRIYYENRTYNIHKNFRIADPAIFRMFTLPFVKGNPKKALRDTFSVVISERMAKNIFGNKNPIGKTININKKYNLTITGILKDLPRNSQLQFDFLGHIGLLSFQKLDPWEFDTTTYVLLKKNVNVKEYNQQLSNFYNEQNIFFKGTKLQPYLQKFTKVHSEESNIVGRIKNITIFAVVAIFILLLVSINFINLSTARSGNRAIEIGMRKAIGANRGNIFRQFFGESILLAFIALCFALLLSEIFSPAFSTLSGKDFETILSGNISLLLTISIFTFLIGLIACCYPALVLSSFQPTDAFKKGLKSPKRKTVRAILVIFQFTISIILIIASFTIYRQINYMKNKNLGFNKDSIIVIPYNQQLLQNISLYKEKLLINPNIVSVSAASNLPIDIEQSLTLNWRGGSKEGIKSKYILVDQNFINVFDLQILEGRNFQDGSISDLREGYIINETALNRMDFEFPIGKKISIGEKGSPYYHEGKIIGIVKDFHFKSLKQEIEPLFMRIMPHRNTHIFIKAKPGAMASVMAFIEETSKAMAPNIPFEFSFLDDAVTEMYDTEKKLSHLITIFSVIAIVISCLGLFGMTSFTAEQRTLEIGIRKIMGASVAGIAFLLSKEYSRNILIATIIAYPIASYTLNKWLQNYAYQVHLDFWMLAAATIITLGFSLLATSYQTIKAALANPIKALRYE